MEREGDFHTEPMCILDRRQIHLRKHIIVQVKVQWKHYSEEEATWEREEIMRHKFHVLFQNYSDIDLKNILHNLGVFQDHMVFFH